jgi:general secretion pathway protein G
MNQTMHIFKIESGINDQKCSGATASPNAGFSLFELMIVVLIIGTIVAIAIPSYMEGLHTARIVKATGDIQMLSAAIDAYRLGHSVYPATLADIKHGDRLDPWGRPYEYLRIQGLKDNGKVRKDKNLVPLNSDYDLYSMGKDGESSSPITAEISRDDIIRANNGRFVGLAENY